MASIVTLVVAASTAWTTPAIMTDVSPIRNDRPETKLTSGLGSDAEIKRFVIDVQTDLGIDDLPVKSVFQSKSDPRQFYYLPSEIRFAEGDVDGDGQVEPLVTLIKFNLAYSDGNWIELADSDRDANSVYQGGVLKATFTFGLRDDELAQMKAALQEYVALPTNADRFSQLTPDTVRLGRLPLDTASFMVTLVDPESDDGGQIALGPFDAPLTDDFVAVQSPLTRAATDVLLPIFEEGTTANAPINVVLAMSYSGFDIPYTVRVEGDWDNVYKSADTRAEAKGNYWFFSGNSQYESFVAEMRQDSEVKITLDGAVPDGRLEEIEGRVMEQLLEACFDTSSIEPAAEDRLDDDAGRADGEGIGELFGLPIGASAGFAMKKVERSRSGSFRFVQEGAQLIDVVDARFGRLDFSFEQKDRSKHLLEINPSDWEVATPGVELALDVEPWFTAHTVSMTFPGVNGLQTRMWSEPEPGESYRFGVFNFAPGEKSPLVPVTYSCVFVPDPGVLEDAGVVIDDPMLARRSLGVVQKTYEDLFGPTIVVPFENDYSRQPTALISRSSIPIRPESYDVKFRVTTPDDYELSEEDEEDGEVFVEDIIIHQDVVAEIPTLDDGAIKTTRRRSERSLSLGDIAPSRSRHSHTFSNVFLFQAPEASYTIDYYVVAGDFEFEVTGQEYTPGSRVRVDIQRLLDESGE